MKNLFIIYDGIENSIFQSQVLEPIKKQTNNSTQFTILSFEKSINTSALSFSRTRGSMKHSQTTLADLRQNNPNIPFIIARKLPFFGRLSLLLAIKFLKKFLQTNSFQQITARGPLAGYIALKKLNKLPTPLISKLTIQARGLCAEEMRFSSQFTKQSIFKKILNPFLYKEYKKIELEVYCKKATPYYFEIESVSNALKEYVIKEFKADKNKIIIAQKDIPELLNPEQIKEYKNIYRKKLEIPDSKTVYCYSGSSRPWQCGEETLYWFKKKYEENKNAFLLVFSQDKNDFEQIAEDFNLEKNCYKILSVKPNELIFYLCACDFGLLFRHKDIINWVSRPTKMLEYKSAGLKVIHNNTVEILKKLNE